MVYWSADFNIKNDTTLYYSCKIVYINLKMTESGVDVSLPFVFIFNGPLSILES